MSLSKSYWPLSRSWGLLIKIQWSVRTIEHLVIFVKILDNLRKVLFGFLVEIWNCNAGSKDGIVWMLCCQICCRFSRQVLDIIEWRYNQRFESRAYIELHCRYTLIHPGDDLLCDPAGGGGERCEKSKAYSTGST